MAARVGVILSGCGYLDGTEIHESVLLLYFLNRAGFSVQCYAPNRDQFHVVNHLTGEPTREVRNVLVESARIARGAVAELGVASMDTLDALVLPGGYGAAKNLSNVAIKGPKAEVHGDVVRLVGEALDQRKPILAICISPAVLAAVVRERGGPAVTVTIGDEEDTAEAIEAMGCRHQPCPVENIVVDGEHLIISTPAYMLGKGPVDVAKGIEASVSKLREWLP